MAHRRPVPSLSHRTETVECDNDSDIDSGVWDDADEEADQCPGSIKTEEEEDNEQDEVEENGGEGADFTVFVAFQGNMDDEDLPQKLEAILSGIPNILDMGWLHFLILFIYFCTSLPEQYSLAKRAQSCTGGIWAAPLVILYIQFVGFGMLLL